MMTIKEAREIYLESDCSYFFMCTYHYSSYIEYRQLGLPKKQENVWKCEKIQMLCREMRSSGDYKLFSRIYALTSQFHDYENLRITLDALSLIKEPLPPDGRVGIAETILGRKFPRVRSGLIYWAYDNGQRGISILLMDFVLEYLYLPNNSDTNLEKRIRKAKRTCKYIIAELKLDFSKKYLQHYYQF